MEWSSKIVVLKCGMNLMIFNIGRFIFIPWLLQCMHFILRITVFVIQFASLGSSQLASTIHSIISVWQCVSTEKWFWRSKIHPPPPPPQFEEDVKLHWSEFLHALYCVYIYTVSSIHAPRDNSSQKLMGSLFLSRKTI